LTDLFLLFPPFKCLKFQCYAVSRNSDLVESRFITYRFTVVKCILYTVQCSDTKRVLSSLTHHLFLEDLEPDVPPSRQGRTHKVTYMLFTVGSLSEKQFYIPDALKIKIFLSFRVIIKCLGIYYKYMFGKSEDNLGKKIKRNILSLTFQHIY